jgi:hypothetical protein
MSATPVVTKASDVKALVDAAANALKLIETIKKQSSGKVSREEIAKEMARILNLVHEARLKDIDLAVEAELKKRGITPSADEHQAESAAPVVAVDCDEADAFDGEQAAALPVMPESKTSGSGLPRSVDVLGGLPSGQYDGQQI